jgi:hypothetical protein
LVNGSVLRAAFTAPCAFFFVVFFTTCFLTTFFLTTCFVVFLAGFLAVGFEVGAAVVTGAAC